MANDPILGNGVLRALAPSGDTKNVACDASGNLIVETSGGGTDDVNLLPATTGGTSIYRNLDVGVTGAIVKNTPGQLYGYFISNNAATARFVKVYNKATAPTQADTPVMTLQIPAAGAANLSQTIGAAFSAGISLRATTGVADNDTGAPTTNDVIVNVFYA